MDDEKFKELPFNFNDPKNEYLLRDWVESPRIQQTGETKEEFVERLKEIETYLQKKEALLKILTDLIQNYLSDKQKEAVILFLMGKTYQEIAEILNIDVRAAWERINGDAKGRGGAINKLKKIIKKKNLKISFP